MQTRVHSANGRDPKFLPETDAVRRDRSWRVAGAGPGFEDRRVEITGPTDRKMAINALNSGAKVWLADQEDATSPTWSNVIEGQITLFDALRGQLSFTNADGREYSVDGRMGIAHGGPAETPTIVMRPRGLHLTEKHIRFHDRAGRSMSASGALVDFGLYFFHNARRLIELGWGRTSTSQAGEPSRGAPLERHLPVRAERPLHPAGDRSRDRADRDHPGGVRDGGDPLRAARSLCRTERRPVGLHLLDRQDVPLAWMSLGVSRPGLHHDDGAVHVRPAGFDTPARCARGLLNQRVVLVE